MVFELKLDICNIPILLNFDNRKLYSLTKSRYSAYITNRKPEFSLNVEAKDGNLRRYKSSEPTVSISRGKSEMSFISATIVRNDMFADIRFNNGEGNLVISNLPTTLDSFLRVLYTLLLILEEGFLIHAVGLNIKNRGVLFPGQSGAGKTTLAEMAPRKVVFSDELVCIRKDKKSFLIIGTPFMGEFKKGFSNSILPLEGVFLLNKTQECRLRKITKDEAVVKLLKTVLFFSDDLYINKKLFNLVYEMVRKFPIYEIGYDKNKVKFNDVKKMVLSVF